MTTGIEHTYITQHSAIIEYPPCRSIGLFYNLQQQFS